MATSLSGGRSRSTWREPPTMGKQLLQSVPLATSPMPETSKILLGLVKFD